MKTNLKKQQLDMRVDEEIWGHRIYNEQTPWLCFLEFLNVLYAEYKSQRAFIEHEPNTLSYTPEHRLYLRNILFNNPRLPAVLEETSNDESRWQRWIAYMHDDQGGFSQVADFSYLQKRFSRFSDFEKMVSFIRSTAIEGESNKRWSSKFVFPYGPACLYEDLQISPSKASVNNDRRFFARTGEILYLMMCRSQKGSELLPYFKEVLFKETTKWNRIIQALQPDGRVERSPSNPREGAYLPEGMRDEYRNLAEDWLALIKCSMPGYDALPYMVTIMGLYIILYILNRSHETLRLTGKRTFVLEIVGSERTSVYQLATASYRNNNRLTEQAVSNYIDQKTASDTWLTALQNHDIDELTRLLSYDFDFEWDDSKPKIAENMVSEFKERALNRHERHLAKVHGTWSSAIGLSSRQNSRSVRYAPRDMLLKTLVLIIVNKRMEFQEFLQAIYQRYGFVIGTKQALKIFDPKKAEQEDFATNEKRLEDRLASLGLLRRLSDACAYVENPFAQE